ncbi:MAG: Gfo/Idh/MocA family oxidoreductase, partial [Humibacter sp.]
MTASIRPARIGVVGASWRAGYFYRVAAAVPSQFIVTGGLTRSSDSAERVTTEWGVPTTTDIEDFLARDAYDYVVVAVSPDAVPAVISDLANRGVPVLAEPP